MYTGTYENVVFSEHLSHILVPGKSCGRENLTNKIVAVLAWGKIMTPMETK